MLPTFQGAWAALVTPITAEGKVNVRVLRDLVEYLYGQGIGGLYLCGSTGEGLYHSPAERELVVETVLDQLHGRSPVIVHVGTVGTRDAVALAQHAAARGASGISSILPPVARDPESVRTHYQAVAAAAPGLPFYPYLFGGQQDALSLLSGLLPLIPNLAGGKYTGPNMYELWQLVGLRTEGWTIFSGMDEQCVFAAMSGAPACIGSTQNLLPAAYRDMRTLAERGDMVQANDLQTHANRIIRIMFSYGYTGALRVALRWLGFDCGDPCPPIPAVPEAKREQLLDELREAGLAELTR
jgi:N-acetylneuraminate lyase